MDKKKILKQFTIFIACGGAGTLTNFFIAILISNFLHPVLSYVIGYLLSLFVAYILNAKLNFKANLTLSAFLKFVLSYIPN
ncbi:MAG: GtrA family protein, partial [Clostridiales Family XIII bacterium]|nr:GtrA family protein [Clostridiales Family XIII bacterium]